KQKEDGSDALKLIWTSGTNKGTNASISYLLKIDQQGNNFANAVVEDLGVAVFEKTFTVKALNNLILSQLKVSPDKEAAIEFKIVAQVSEKMAVSDTSNTLTIKVTPYKPV